MSISSISQHQQLIWMSMNLYASLQNRFCQLFTHHYGGVWETLPCRKLIRKSATRRNVEVFFEGRKNAMRHESQLHKVLYREIYGAAGLIFFFRFFMFDALRFMIIKQCNVNRELKRAIWLMWQSSATCYMCSGTIIIAIASSLTNRPK